MLKQITFFQARLRSTKVRHWYLSSYQFIYMIFSSKYRLGSCSSLTVLNFTERFAARMTTRNFKTIWSNFRAELTFKTSKSTGVLPRNVTIYTCNSNRFLLQASEVGKYQWYLSSYDLNTYSDCDKLYTDSYETDFSRFDRTKMYFIILYSALIAANKHAVLTFT